MLPIPLSSWLVVDGDVTQIGGRRKPRLRRAAQRARMRERIELTGKTGRQ